MVRTTVSALALCSIGGAALAGGVERSAQPVGILFEEGNYVQLGFTYVSPDVSGTLGGNSSGDMAPSYTNFSLAYKQQLSDRLDLALIIDQPNGADVDYGDADASYNPFVNGTTAELDGYEVSALLKYRFDNGVSIYGGPRIQSLEAELNGLGIPGGYDLEADRTYELGYAAGVAYERKDIALRVALTYRSAIDHDFDSTETVAGGATIVPGSFTSTIPQSLNLEFQTGVAEDTLVFGNVRWQDWSEFDISPPSLPGPLIDYDSDYITYNLGVGRRFNENWSGAISVGYEGETGDLQGNLAPRDGFASIGVGATYTKGNMKVTGGVRYIALGGATTTTITADFDNNDAWAAGIQIGFQL